MVARDKRIDAYIEKSADFAKPILSHLRDIVHEACPDAQETLKWGFPHFMYQGMMCGMAAFKAHCTFTFWKGSLVVDEAVNKGEEAHGQFGRLTSVRQLPSKRVLIGYVKKAMKLNEEGVGKAKSAKKATAVKTVTSKAATKAAPAKKTASVVVPPALTSALKKNRKALAAFEAMSPSHRKEYAQWVAEAKREETQLKRIAAAVEQIADGKSRHWKYQG